MPTKFRSHLLARCSGVGLGIGFLSLGNGGSDGFGTDQINGHLNFRHNRALMARVRRRSLYAGLRPSLDQTALKFGEPGQHGPGSSPA
jgi:hypothetical protein